MFINEIFLFFTALTVSPINAKVLLGYETLVLQEEADPEIVASVLAKGYAPDLDETELEEVGRDPFLIAYAVTDPGHRVVVSIEVSAPAKKRANRRVPDVCRDNGVSVCNTFTMLRELGFTTTWLKPTA
ncbi:conserved hypothetical protein [Burkholderia ambifaria MC40-6]|jgi:hypothetical protein|uniref:Uncharacterized protein n=1 Tax=Burkholderia ambifaria (strain MC40-6) TaxID=398577 RepID=B1YXZ3_BURA4|nr:conserved hypothetical protein [Burkholderia ambifaria MC40-6]